MAQMRFLLMAVLMFLGSSAFAQISDQAPSLLLKDVQRKARWLPAEIKQLGLNEAAHRRWDTLPTDVQELITQARIPYWMIALIPSDAGKQAEIVNQLRALNNLAGSPSPSPIGARAEQLLFFGGAAQLPTPGDVTTGASLGSEGCTAAMARYVLAQLKIEFPGALATMPDSLVTSQSSSEMKSLFLRAARAGAPWLKITSVPFSKLQDRSVEPGSLMIAEKPGGTHVFGWTRVPAFWGWNPSDIMAVGNTGLAQFGDRMILAQEYLTEGPTQAGEGQHNLHGPLNSHQVISKGGQPILSDSRTNVYSVRGSDFIIVSFR